MISVSLASVVRTILYAWTAFLIKFFVCIQILKGQKIVRKLLLAENFINLKLSQSKLVKKVFHIKMYFQFCFQLVAQVFCCHRLHQMMTRPDDT